MDIDYALKSITSCFVYDKYNVSAGNKIPQEGLGRFFLLGSPLLLCDELAFFRQQRRF